MFQVISVATMNSPLTSVEPGHFNKNWFSIASFHQDIGSIHIEGVSNIKKDKPTKPIGNKILMKSLIS